MNYRPQPDCGNTGRCISRRRFLGGLAGIASGLILPPARADVAVAGERSLSLLHLHTGEKTRATYWADGAYQEEGLRTLNRLLRDHRSGESHQMDPKLLDLMFVLGESMGGTRPFHVISAYRSPGTNELLRDRSSGVAKRSLHMQGKAIDIRLPGRDLKQLHRAARSLKLGGVGLYAKSDFIHVDTGRVRYW